MVLEFQIKPLQFLFSPYRIQKAETILFSSNCGFRKSGRFFVTRLDYWIVQMCFLCWKRCGPEITDRKQNTSSVYLPMWQGNSIFFFFFNLVPPGLLYEFLIFVSRWDISRSCDIPVENTQRSQRAGLWKKTVLLLIWSNPIATFSPVSLLNWLALVNIKGNLHPRMPVLCLQTALSYISCNLFFSNGLGDNKRLTVNNHDNTVFPYYVIAS